MELDNIFGLFEREFSSDILALTNIGKRISGNKEIMIHFIGNIPSVYTDCKFIYLPDKYKKDIKSAQGLVAHESGHIGYGSFELGFIKLVDTLSRKYKVPPLFAKNLINVIEDVRINAINEKKFPGFYRNLRILTYKMLPEIKSKIFSNSDILTYLNLYMEDFDGFQKRPKLNHFDLNKSDWKGIAKVKKFLYRSLSPSASILSCDVLCKILKKYLPKEPSNPLPNKGSPRGQNNNTINQMEMNSRNKRNDQKSELDKTSEELIEKLKNTELDPDDLDKLMDSEEDDDEGNPDINKRDKEKRNEGRKRPSKEGFNEDEDVKESANTEDTLDPQKNDLNNPKNEDGLDDEQNKRGSKSNNSITENEKVIPLEDFKNELRKIQSCMDEKLDDKKSELIRQIGELIERADDAMQERLLTLEKQEYQPTPSRSKGKRYVDDVKIESQSMMPDSMTYAQIKSKYMNIIKRLKFIFADLKNKSGSDTFQKKGRLNNKLIKAVTSDYQFKKCFTRKIINKELRLILIVDISGSMRGIKIRAAKIAMIMLYEALEDIANIRIVLFTGAFNALNILVKDFNEKLDPRKFDKFGCHSRYCQNIDGVSIKHEADKLEKEDIIIVISDGQPSADGGYSLYDAIPDIHDVRKKFRVFAFSIDSQGEYLTKMYGKDWILTSSRNELELGQKMVKFCQIVVKEFYR
ncbi:MAG: hypothetical protein ACFE8J_03795 [Candidatus Heimdallarchaeota archaeon]